MSERDALLSAILANPDDDLARLVFADWLEETSRPAAVARARFVRLQIELARGTPRRHFPERPSEITDELDALAARWVRAWLAELPPRVAKAVWKQNLGAGAFRRGFLDGVTLGADLFLWDAPALFAAAPVTELHLHGGYSDTKALLASPYFKRLRAVHLSGSWEGDRLSRRVHECWDYGALREFDLSGCRLTDHGAWHLANCRGFAKLAVLRVRDNRLTTSGVWSLASASMLANLETLDVTGNPGVRGWTALPAGDRPHRGPRLVY